MAEPRAFINAVAGAVPPNDVHQLFVDWAEGQVEDPRMRKLFLRMAERSGIDHRWSVLPPAPACCSRSPSPTNSFAKSKAWASAT